MLMQICFYILLHKDIKKSDNEYMKNAVISIMFVFFFTGLFGQQSVKLTEPIPGIEKESANVPDSSQVQKANKDFSEKELLAYVDEVKDKPLLPEVPQGSGVIDMKRNRRLGYTELAFKNGATVVLKPNDYKKSQILFLATSPGGHSVYALDKFMSAYVASDIINQSGVGVFNQEELEIKLAGKAVILETEISTLYERVKGSCTPNNFETLLKLNYLHFTHHKIDSNAYKKYISELKNRAEYIWSDPQYVFYDTIVKTATLNHPRELIVPTKKQIQQISYEQVREVFRERFSDAGDFTFFIVGNFEMDTIIPYLEKYLGRLPSNNNPETWKDVEPEFPSTSKYLYVYKGTEPQSTVAIIMKDTFDWNNDRLKFDVINKILEIRLQESMREEQGEVDYITIDGSYSRYPDPGYSLYLSFVCNPEDADSLAYAVISEMREIINNGPNEKILNKVKKSILKDREANKEKNSYWINNLESLYFYDEPIIQERKFKRELKRIKPEDMQEIANKYYQVDHYVMGILYPKNVEIKR